MTSDEMDVLERLTEVLAMDLSGSVPEARGGVDLPDFAPPEARMDVILPDPSPSAVTASTIEARVGELPEWHYPERELPDLPEISERWQSQSVTMGEPPGAFPDLGSVGEHPFADFDSPDLPDYPQLESMADHRSDIPQAREGPSFPDVPEVGLHGRINADGYAIDAAQDSFASPPADSGEDAREVIELLKQIHRTLESMGRSNVAFASASGGASADGGAGSDVHVFDASAEEGYPWASPSVEVSTIPGTGGAGGSSLGSAPVPRSPLLSGRGGSPSPTVGRSSFFEPGMR